MKEFRSKLMYIMNIVFGILALVFLSQSYYGVKGIDFNISGYDFAENVGDLSKTLDAAGVFNIFVIIAVSVMMIASILALLVEFGAIKSSKVQKFANLANVIAGIVFVLSALIAMSCVASEVEAGAVMGWAGIVNFILGIFAVGTTVLGKKFSK